MIYPKNIHFTLLIKVKGRLFEFNFLQRNPAFYEMDTSDEYGNRFVFSLVQEGNDWKVKGKLLPSWITEAESLIGEALRNRID